ncbi:hypothetical protein [Halorussus vallis]|uniref:hypothetical protein n=1 Tax=Halorussus vallis TaxID=2953749 RepID=UPI00209D5E69|nr:hypothetical protein [Halorussus vallis]
MDAAGRDEPDFAPDGERGEVASDVFALLAAEVEELIVDVDGDRWRRLDDREELGNDERIGGRPSASARMPERTPESALGVRGPFGGLDGERYDVRVLDVHARLDQEVVEHVETMRFRGLLESLDDSVSDSAHRRLG